MTLIILGTTRVRKRNRRDDKKQTESAHVTKKDRVCACDREKVGKKKRKNSHTDVPTYILALVYSRK